MAERTLAEIDDNDREQRRHLLREIEDDVRYTASLIGRDHLSSRVIEAIAEVPRHAFVPSNERYLAYANAALPIGCGQTISQPYIVALMTDLLEPKAGDVVLEIGTGSGYQAAVLSRLVKKLYSIEIFAELSDRAREVLDDLGCDNVVLRVGDGSKGWPEHAPFDSIIVTAAAKKIPEPLVEQLKPGGCMVIPIGGTFFAQKLVVVKKDLTGEITTTPVLAVAFVPLRGGG
jgi:protein-L-isoaspartate(D-aspartate) O-methyltransferase